MLKKRCFIISEIGVNHNGSVDLAKKMIDSSIEAGADAVKFQTFTAESLVSKSTPKVKYQKNTTSDDETHYEMIKSLELSRNDHIELIKYCKNKIEFMSTPYDVESAQFLDELGVKIFKTASADIVDHRLHKFIARTGKPVIISTGMATIEEIDEVIEIYKSEKNSNVTLLHCISNYPCNFESLNLSVLKTLQERYGFNVGYSDHAIGPIPALASVVLGSTVVEKHFTIDKNLPGPDHKASSSPEEFKELVDLIRFGEKIRGSSLKQIQDEEKEMRLISRKSIFYSKDLKKGVKILDEHLTLRRPGTGLYSNMIPNILGKNLKKDIKSDTIVQLDDLE